MGVFVEVEEADGFGAVFHVFGEDLGGVGFGDSGGLFAEGVLADGEDFVVGEEAEGEGVELGHVAADEEGGVE